VDVAKLAHDSEAGRFISRDVVTRGEQVEGELDALIERRHDKRVAEEGHRPSEEMYEESARRYQEQMRAAARYEWQLHHATQAERLRRTMEELISHHEGEPAKLMEVEAKGA
jgi:hypothetical protein